MPSKFRRLSLRQFALVAAVLAWSALLLQLWLTLNVVVNQGRGIAMGLVIYFGYFTVLTNLLAALVLSACAAGSRFPRHRWLTAPVAQTCTAAAITIVGLVYFFILRLLWKPQGAQFLADAALHYAVPVLMVVFWAVAVPRRAVGWRDAPWLFVYPLVYLAYVFVRGEIFGLYPYEFVDVNKLGYPSALLNAAGLMVAYALVAGLFCGLKAIPRRTVARTNV